MQQLSNLLFDFYLLSMSFVCIMCYCLFNHLEKQENSFEKFAIHMLNRVTIGKSIHSVKWQIQEFWELSEVLQQIFTKFWIQVLSIVLFKVLTFLITGLPKLMS